MSKMNTEFKMASKNQFFIINFMNYKKTTPCCGRSFSGLLGLLGLPGRFGFAMSYFSTSNQ